MLTTMSKRKKKFTLEDVIRLAHTDSLRTHERLDRMDTRLDRMDFRFDGVGKRLDNLEGGQKQIDGRLNNLEAGQERIERRLDSRVQYFEHKKLEKRVRVIEKKVGIS